MKVLENNRDLSTNLQSEKCFLLKMNAGSKSKRIIRPKDNGDGSLWCNACKVSKEGPCVFHTDIIPDQPILPHAFATLPKELEIDCKSMMKQKGVFSRVAITKPTIFGPLVGVLSNTPSTSVRYVLRMQDGSVKFYRLESDRQCNWMKFVRQADSAENTNVLAFQQNDKIYFVSIRPLEIGDELRVGYLSQYAATVEKCRKMPDLADTDNVAMMAEGSDDEMETSKNGMDLNEPLYTFLPGCDDNEGSAWNNSGAGSLGIDIGVSDFTTNASNSLPAAEIFDPVTAAETSPVPEASSTRILEPSMKRLRGLNGKAAAVTPSGDSSLPTPSTSRKTRSSNRPLSFVKPSSHPEPAGKESYKCCDEQLQAVLDANPYQFPEGPQNSAAWNSAYEKLISAGHSPESTGVRNLQCLVSRHLKLYRDELARCQTPEEVSLVQAKRPLAHLISEYRKNQPTTRSSQTRRSTRTCQEESFQDTFSIERDLSKVLQAVVSANPYQYVRGPAQQGCWLTAFHDLVMSGIMRGPEATGAGRLQTLMLRQLKSFQIRLAEAAVQVSDFTPETPTDSLLKELLELKQNRPNRKRVRDLESKDVIASRRLKRVENRKIRAEVHGSVPRKVIPRDKSGKSQWWKHRCDVCTAEFRTLALFSLHGVKHGLVADTQSLSTTCPACGVEHATLEELMQHIERHERRPSIYRKVTKFQCETCLRYFSSQEFLDRHIRRMHTDIGSERNFECSTCHEKYITLAALKSHERTHSARKFFECPICLLGLGGAGEMQEHAECHRVDGQFSCRFCGKTFPEFVMLRRHLRMQHDNKTYNCQVCQKIFTNQHGWQKHKLVHEANFAFQCETCGRKFKRKTKLDDHVKRLHNPNRVYKMKERSEKVAKAFATAEVCQFCTRQYSSWERLLIHQRAKHLERMPAELRFSLNEDTGGSGSENSDFE